MKKICFFMETPFTHGGEQRVVSILSNMLVNKGYDVSIMCTDMTVIRDNSLYNLDENVKICYLDGYNNKIVKKIRLFRNKLFDENLLTGKHKNSLFIQRFINCDLITTLLLRRKINKEDFDVVVSLGMYNKILVRVTPYVKAKVIGWQHSSSERYFNLEHEWFYNQEKFSKYMINRYDEYIVLTNEDKRFIKDKFNEDVSVINNPKSILSEKVTDLNNKYFLAVGRFDPIKNFLGLIDIFNEYHKVNKEWKLRIIGDGYLKDEYIKRIKKYRLSKYIEIIDYTPNIDKYYLDSSIYLMSSFHEGWGMVISEAIEFGLPVISYNITLAPELIIDNYNGFIVERYDEKAFLDRMIELSSDKKLLKKFSKNSKIFSESKDDSYIIDKWLEVFDDKIEYDNKIKSVNEQII